VKKKVPSLKTGKMEGIKKIYRKKMKKYRTEENEGYKKN